MLGSKDMEIKYLPLWRGLPENNAGLKMALKKQ